jgi:hypothetical protein
MATRSLRPVLRPVLQTALVLAVCGSLLAGGLSACSGVGSLTADAPKLTSAEKDSVRVQVEKALTQKRYNLAWEQEVAAGADRAQLERIALLALRGRSGHAESMLAALRERHGDLTPEMRALITQEAEAAKASRHWERAVQIELQAAGDAPAYEAAWALYRAAPADRAPGLLKAITAAKEAHAESDD